MANNFTTTNAISYLRQLEITDCKEILFFPDELNKESFKRKLSIHPYVCFKTDMAQIVPGTISQKQNCPYSSDECHAYLQLGYTQPNQSLIFPATDTQTSCTSFTAYFPATKIQLLSTSSFLRHSPQSLGSQSSSAAAVSSAAQQDFI